MARGRYVIPVIMGRPGSELFIMKGDLLSGQSVALAKLASQRGLSVREEKIVDGFIASGKLTGRPTTIKEVVVVSGDNPGDITDREAALIQGYINNTLPGAFKAPELTGWFLFEKPSDLTPLKLARFSINLLSPGERKDLIGWLKRFKFDFNHPRYEAYR